MLPVRVTFVLPNHARKASGGARVVYQYANGLAGRGHDVVVVHAALLEPWQYRPGLSLRREPKVVARGLLDTVQARRSGPGRPAWQQVDPRVRLEYVSTLAPGNVPEADVVVATAWRTAESVARYPASRGRKHYLIQHYETWDAAPDRVDATWLAPLRKIVIAEWLLEQGSALGADDLLQVPNAVDHGRFRLLRPVDDRPRRVAMLWSPAPEKGGTVGLRALELARRTVPDLRAVLFGVRPRPARLPAWVDYVHNPAPTRLVEDVYNGSAVYLCPSRSEGWHLPPAEAMACGCAVVSTDQGGVRDYARHGRTALLSPVGDPYALADNLVRLLTDDAERARLAEAGNRLIRTFSWDRSVDSFERFLSMPMEVSR